MSTRGLIQLVIAAASLVWPCVCTASESRDVAVESRGTRVAEFVRSIDSQRDVSPQRSFWSRLVDIVAGPAPVNRMVRPYDVKTDSTGRVLVTDPGVPTVHVFDFKRKKYLHLEGPRHNHLRSPIGVAVDAEDNIYVTDSLLGKVFVFDSRGSFRRTLGEKGGEGIFKRPTGIAIDAANKLLYLTDTLRNKIYVCDLAGNVLFDFGERGTGPGQFNYPTTIALNGSDLLVVDAMNFRVQIFDRVGHFRGMFGNLGGRSGTLNRAKGIATDNDGNIYVVDGAFETVQVFDSDGSLLYYFGSSGRGDGQFQIPAGIWIDSLEQVFVADSYNHRVQVLKMVHSAGEAKSP